MTDEKRFDIEFDPNSIFQSNKGAVTAEVYWKFGEECFPSVKWSDFVVVISTWWLDECNQMKNESQLVQFDFMDGPYFFKARMISNTDISLTFHDEHNSLVTDPYLIKKDYFFSVMTTHAENVVESCKNLKCRDLFRLKNAISNFSSI